MPTHIAHICLRPQANAQAPQAKECNCQRFIETPFFMATFANAYRK